MNPSPLRTGPRLATRPQLRLSKTMVFPLAVAVCAGSVALCGTSGASALPRSPLSSARSKPAPAKVYLQRSGTGNRALPAVSLPAKWTVIWRFDCQNAAKQRGTFVLRSSEQGHWAVKLTDQTGLGGGGQKPFTTAGRYGFGINTACGWDLTVESTPLTAAR